MHAITKSERFKLIVARHHARLLRQGRFKKWRPVVVFEEPDNAADDIEVSALADDDAATIRGITMRARPMSDN
jgi:hypothetical protein